MNIYKMYICNAAVIYLVSFVPELPLFSRNPNFTLTQEDGRYGQKEREMKNIRGNGNFLLRQSHSAFSTDNINYRSVHYSHNESISLHKPSSSCGVNLSYERHLKCSNYAILYTHVLENKPVFNRLAIKDKQLFDLWSSQM